MVYNMDCLNGIVIKKNADITLKHGFDKQILDTICYNVTCSNFQKATFLNSNILFLRKRL